MVAVIRDGSNLSPSTEQMLGIMQQGEQMKLNESTRCRSGRRRLLRRPAAVVATAVLLAAAPLGRAASSSDATVDTINVGVATLQEQYVDPILANQGGNLYPIKWAIGEHLLNLDLNAQFVPGLAESWTVSDDDLTWTVQLREGVLMHDGSTFTARDVKTSIDRIDVSDPVFSAYAPFKNRIDEVTVVDDLTVEIRTTVPYPNVLAQTPAPVATDYFEEVGEEAFRAAPIAAGPFMFDSQVLNQSITLTRFDDFWDESRTPNFETLVLHIMPEESSRIAALRAGQIDVAHGLSPAGVAQVEGVEGIRLITTPSASLPMIYFQDLWYPDEDSLLHDARVRRALLMAIDRQGIVDSIYNGYGEVANNLVFPVTIGADPDLETVPYDPEGARALLAEAGASDLSITLNTYNATTVVPDVQRLAEVIVSFWQAIGVDAELNVVDAATYLLAVRNHEYRGGVILGMPGLQFAEPSEYAVFLSTTGAYSNLDDPEITQLLADMAAAVDPDVKLGLAQEFARIAHDELWGLPLFYSDAVSAVNDNVLEFQTMAGNPYTGPFWYLVAA